MSRPPEPGRTAIGLMSGTSADGVDAALLRIGPGPRPRVEPLAFRTHPYPEGLRRHVLLAGSEAGLATAELCSLHREIGEAFAAAALALLDSAGRPPEEVDFCGSHGQTVRHLPEGGRGPHGDLLPSTLQMGDPSVIAERTGLTVVSDFRARDVAAGGSGAPLTPWAHQVLFAREEASVAFLNLGGIANLTYIPPAGAAGLLGFDAGPGNMALDALAEKFSDGKERFDRDGRMASAGTVDSGALAALMDHEYLRRPPPKSTGRETFGEAFLARALERMRGARPEDCLATLTAFSAECIRKAIQDFFPPNAPPAEVIVGGGGLRNRTLMRHIERGLAPTPVASSGARGIPPEAVEAVSFALLAWATLRGTEANVPAATGARKKTVLGNITPGRNFFRDRE